MNRDSDEIAKSASEEYTYSGYASAVTLPPQREALTERDYRVLFEILPQGILCQDRAGRIVLANPAAQQILGLSLDQLRGRTVFDKNWQLIREDGLPFPISDHPAIQALRSGEPAPPMLMGVFNPREHAYRWIQVSAVPQIRPGEDAPSLIYTVFHDQTQHKEWQDLLRASEQRARARVAELEAAFQAIAEHVVIYDRYGHVLQTSEGVRKLLDIEQASNFMQKSLHDRSSTVSVRDCGVGIFPADLERIFERYAHVEMNARRSSEETGLSLPIVREIVQLHGGQVWAESVVGKGSIFHFTVRFTDSRL
jgi:PAS domain S-box-containing protein